MSKYLVTLTPTGKFFFGGDMRFGINGKKPMTQKRVAEVLGISRSYVSRIEKNALAKIKNAFS